MSFRWTKSDIALPGRNRRMTTGVTLLWVTRLAVMGLLFGAGSPSASAQVAPQIFGFDCPPGVVSYEPGQVRTRDERGRMVVARRHVDVGERRIVMLPDGHLVMRSAAEAPETEEAFTAATKDDLAEQLLAHPLLQDFQVKQTRRYLYVYNTSEQFAEVTSRILETMYPGVVYFAEAQRIEVEPSEVPLVVIMFRDEQQFQRYRQMPPGVVAYYNVLSNEVVMYEESKLRDLKPELALQQSLATIAHEGAHQILHNIGVQQRLSVWPMWLSEGLAEYLAPTSVDRRFKWKGAGQVNDMRMFELEQYLKAAEPTQPSGKLVEHTVIAARLTSTGYATAWSLTHYLAKNARAEFQKYVQHVSRLRPLESGGAVVGGAVVPANLELFREYFGEDLDEVGRRLVLHLRRLPYRDPFAEWPHFVGLVLYPDGRREVRRANLFHTRRLADKWCEEMVGQVPEQNRSRAQSTVREFPNRVVAERFARTWQAQK